MKITTNRLYSDNSSAINLDSLMEKVDWYLNNEVKKPFRLVSVSYVPVLDRFCAIMTIETI